VRAVVITRAGPPEVLRVEERPDPEPGPGQVAIDVRACGVNFADTMARVGLYPDAPDLPAVVGYEVAGTVVGSGERVLAGTRFGGYASRVVVGEEDVVPLPERLSFEQGAAIPVNYATAWAGLVRYGGLQAGERVLLQAAAGGVGIAAIQLAKRFGAEVYGAASPAKHDAVRAQGAVAVDYGQRGLPKFDLVMDAVGGRSFRRSYDLLNPGGRLIAFGASAVMSGEKRNLITAARAALRMPRFNLIKQMSASKSVIGLNMLTLWDHAGTLRRWIDPLVELMEDGTIQPVVAAAVPFDAAPEAHRMIAERRNVGKVVLTP
jgi:NADPH:quinone reductase-like Zn-dependent oxidoreductase